MKKRNIFIVSFIVIFSFIVSCDRSQKAEAPSNEYAAYIKAYTGSIISESSRIRIELASKPEYGTFATENLFKFSPSIKGATRWISSDIVEFIPEEGALKAGQTYTGSFALGKIVKTNNKKINEFPFSFKVATKEAILKLNDIVISSNNLTAISIQGSILFNEPISKEVLSPMITCSEDCTISVTEAGDDNKHYLFSVDGLERSDKDRTINLTLKTEKSGYKSRNSLTVQIPATEGFNVISSSLEDGVDPYIDILFSQPLDSKQNLDGIVELEGVSRYYTKIIDNKLRVYLDTFSDKTKLIINSQLKDITGNQLNHSWNEIFRAKENKPAVNIPLKGNILPDSKKLILPFMAVSLNAVDLKIVKIYQDNILSFLQVNNLNGDSELRRSGRIIYKQRIRLDSDPSKDLREWQSYSVDLSNIFKKEPGAIYRISLSFNQEYSIYGKNYVFAGSSQSDQMRKIEDSSITEEENSLWDIPNPYYWDEGAYDWSVYNWDDVDDPTKPSYYMGTAKFPEVNLMTSDIGVTVKYSGNDQLFIATNDILTAKPMYGVDIFVYDYQLRRIGSGRTDSEGLEEIKLSGKPFALIAKRNGSTTYLKITEGTNKSLSRFDVGGQVLEKGLKAYIYGERGIWRPTDTLHLTMIIQSKGKALPNDHPATMELYTPKGQFHSKLISNSQNNFYSFAVPTSESDPTGIWNAYFKIGGATFHKALRIESIKPNRLKVNTNFEANILQSGSRVTTQLSSSWLTGPAASGLTAKLSMTLKPGATTFKDFEGYIFKNPTIDFKFQESELAKVVLDENGKANLNIEIPTNNGAPGLLEADILTTIEENGGDASFATTTLPLSPFSAYVGVLIPEEELETDIEHKFKVAVVNSSGSRVKGHKVEYRIYKIDWYWWWENRETQFDSYINGTGSNLVSSGAFTSGNTDYAIPFKIDYPSWGRYLIYIKDLDSGHATGGTFTIDWPAYRGRSQKSDPKALTMLTFSTDKPSYKIKEEATVYIPAAADGYALVSIENSTTVISRSWVKTKATSETPFKFAITEQMSPNCYVHITLIQPHGNTVNDLPIRLYGVQPIIVEDNSMVLEPKISMPDVIRPAENFTIKVSEKNGRPMTYTLAIVDEGLLDLTAFKTPNPHSEFNKKEALGVNTWDVYDNVIGAYSGKFSPMLSIGGDQTLVLGAKKDNRFNPVVRYYGPFTLKSGSKSHSVKLPTYIGSVRVMVVAAHEGASGNAEKTVPVRSELMVLSSLPRVLSTGDKIVLPVNVFAMTDEVKDVRVKIKVEGPVGIVGAAETSLSFAKPGDKLTRFSLVAKGEGVAKITVNAESGNYKTFETTSIEVRDPSPVIANSVSTLIKAGSSYTFEGLSSDNVTLSLSSFPAFDFNKAFEFVDNYGYYCSEQLAARGLFIVNTLNHLSATNAPKAKELIPSLLAELYSRQLADGGFAYLPGQTISDPWVSSMVGQFFVQAASLGFDVNKGVINSWKQFQTKNIQNYRASDDDLIQAYRLYTLALAMSSNNAAMNRMKESNSISIQARMMLASTYAICGKSAIASNLLEVEVGKTNTKKSSSLSFGSPLRDKAITLEAYTLAGEIDKAIKLASELSTEFEQGYSTQELAFATSALNRLAAKINSEQMKFVINTEKEVETAHSSYSKEFKCVDGRLTVKNTSKGSIYASTTSLSKAKNSDIAASAVGLRMSIEYKLPNGDSVGPLTIRQGTDFTAIITVQSTTLSEDYDRLALKYIIPSGWEISPVRDSLVSAQNAYDYNDIRDDKVLWYFSLDRGTTKTFKVNLRAAYEGEFVMPSSICEDMYNVNVRTVTSSNTAIVNK